METKPRILYLMRILEQYTDEEHPLTTKQLIEKLQNDYGISAHRTTLAKDIVALQKFEIENSGGYPIKDIIVSDGEDYEVRVFLSLDDANEYYSIKKPLDFFMKNTKGKIVPIGIDSGDNYYCVNNKTGKVYYWCASENSYFCISASLSDFIKLFD